MSRRWALPVLVACGLLVGCAGPTPPEELYAVGTDRAALLKAGFDLLPDESRGPGEPARPAVAAMLRGWGIEGKVHRYDVFWVPRGFMGLGVSWDYVFYDDRERVVYAWRRSVD